MKDKNEQEIKMVKPKRSENKNKIKTNKK